MVNTGKSQSHYNNQYDHHMALLVQAHRVQYTLRGIISALPPGLPSHYRKAFNDSLFYYLAIIQQRAYSDNVSGTLALRAP